jgi:hypothetical protein
VVIAGELIAYLNVILGACISVILYLGTDALRS